MKIESNEESDLEAIVSLSLRAWAPVFESLRVALGPAVYRAFYGDDWRMVQRAAVEGVCGDPDVRVWVAREDERMAGFVAAKLHPDDQMGEVYMIAVDPAFQRRGVAAAMMRHAVQWFRAEDMSIAMVETGGDPGHAPARRTYEAAGFALVPVARYFKPL